LKNKPLTYTVINSTVVIKPKVNDILPTTAIEPAREVIPLAEVRGRVVDSKGSPVEGVSVQLKGTSTGTTTDANGMYSLSFSGPGTLVFSYVGFETQEVGVNDQSTINIVLRYSDDVLGGVVVTALGIK